MCADLDRGNTSLLQVRTPCLSVGLQVTAATQATGEPSLAASPPAVVAPAAGYGALPAHHQLGSQGHVAQTGYNGSAPFMQVNVNLIQSPYPPQRPIALHPPPSFDWAAGSAADTAAQGRDHGAHLAAQQQDSAAALAAWAANGVPPHMMRSSSIDAGEAQGNDAASPPQASPGRRLSAAAPGSLEAVPRSASGAGAARSGGHGAEGADAPLQSPQAPHSARQQLHNGHAPSPQMAMPGRGYYGEHGVWSAAQYPIAAAFAQLLSPAGAMAAQSMGHAYPPVYYL